MKKEDIKITDLYRIMMGDVPVVFYVELIIRSLFVYLVLTFGMKYLGKRQSSQLTRSELAATSTLAAATGLVILAPDRGLIPPLIIVGIIIMIQRFVHHRSMKNKRFEFATEGHLSLIVNEGVIDNKTMVSARISHEQLLMELRNMNILSLGLIKRLYLEANGSFTVIRQPIPRPGLASIPVWDKEMLNDLPQTKENVCTNCATIVALNKSFCPNCGGADSSKAVLIEEDE